ncbi:hypothetical protein [Indioceanicola profundi]|uniref:hypothetical protein n=1 Tax=Indioceanicola profundi TaxID=2220096 RepID=UPI000E6AC6A5|nr:hypothetical protein [Indioceanicola profundi]
MIVITWMHVVSFLALALGGAGMVLSARRLHRVIKRTERRIAAAVDEKNAAAAELRLARRDEAAIRQAIEEAEEAIHGINRSTEEAEQRIEALKRQPKQVIGMADQEWQRYDRLWRVRVMNPSLPSALSRMPGGQAGEQGRMVHGFARSGLEFKARVEGRFAPSAGFIVGEAEMADLETAEPAA